MWDALKQRWVANRTGARWVALVTGLLGLALWAQPLGLGRGLTQSSFDLPTLLSPKVVPQEILLIQLDETSLGALHQSAAAFSRTNHANLLRKLTAAPARLVVFDVYFPDSEPRASEDEALAEAIRDNQRVVLAGDYSKLPGHSIHIVHPPLEAFATNASGWGVPGVALDTDLAVRWHDPGPSSRASLAWAASEALGAPVTRVPESRFEHRWLRYYGQEGTLPAKPYSVALTMASENFRDKIVFVGGKPETQPLNAVSDLFATPFTGSDGPLTSGMEIQATMFLNLWRNEWLTRLPAWVEACLLLVCGAGLGYTLTLLRPFPGLAWALALMLAVAGAGCLVHWYGGFWVPWLLVAGAEIPCAWAGAAVWHLRKLPQDQAPQEVEHAEAFEGATLPAPTSPSTNNQARAKVGSASESATVRLGTPVAPVLADHELLRRIGKGAYGEVYLARNAVGLYHAVKVVYRGSFSEAGPYEREFRGIQKYMPVSLGHPGLVPLLHVGRNDEAGFFFYVMELGDDKSGSTKVDPDTYAPKNLLDELKQRRFLPGAECLEVFLALTGALQHLHGEKLVHRDIKPSNIIFVKGMPKFADIGLVTDLADTALDVSYVGTEGYIPPEGPGTAAADVFSLGMVLYQAATGLDRHSFPELPGTLTGRSDMRLLLDINRVILRACQTEARKRYPSAAEMQNDLLRLRQGKE